jgi:16S rRNA (cytosine967-C5)-methyltransferase
VRVEVLGPDTLARLKGWADCLLLDVPCSGLGTLRRQPDLKWRLTAERLAELQAVQREILMKYPEMVKPGGRVGYATCSILPGENRRQVEWRLARGGGSLVGETVVSAAQTGWDGFYAAVWRVAPD